MTLVVHLTLNITGFDIRQVSLLEPRGLKYVSLAIAKFN
jgi:hypothetical protein